MLRRLTIASTTLLLVLLPPLAAAEGPVDERCDESGLLACAAANAGASVRCAVSLSGADVTCSWTSGDVWWAYSPLFLSGHATHAWTRTVTLCVDSACSTLESASGSEDCAWLPGSDCEGAPRDPDGSASVTLQMGQCVRVTVVRSVQLTAWASAGGSDLASATWGHASEGAGAACLVDDGR